MRQVPKGLDFVHWSAVQPDKKEDAALASCAHHGVNGGKTSAIPSAVTCPTCRLAMIRAGKAKAVPKFGTMTADKRAVYL